MTSAIRSIRAGGLIIAMVLSLASPIQANPVLLGDAPTDEPGAGVKISDHDRHAVNLVLTGYSERAAKLYRPFLDHSTLKSFSGTAPFLVIGGTNGLTAPGRIIDVKYDDPDRLIDPRVTAVVVQPGQARVIQALYWPVPGYGVVWLRADNGGRGYQLGKPGTLVLNLNYEFARTQLRIVLDRAKKLPGRELSDGVRRLLDEAERALDQARARVGAERAKHADEALAKALRAGDDIELDVARRQIPQARMGRVLVRVKGPTGAPVEGATVGFRQVSRDFLFGVVESFGFLESKPGDEGFKRIFGTLADAGFNHYTVSLFWDQLEQKPGQYRFADWESQLGVRHAVDAGMSLKMHALLQESVPKHVKGDGARFAAASRQYFEAATQRFQKDNGMGDAVVIWQAANEPSTNHYAEFDEPKKVDLIRQAVQTLKARVPNAKVMVNDVYADWGQRWEGKPGPGGHRVVSPFEMFETLNRKGVGYDLMGLEWYPGLRVNFFNVIQLQGPLMDFAATSLDLDRYAQLGKPLHITEFTVPSSWKDEWKSGTWRERWSPEVQADYIERFYTLAFAKKHVREITYWGISDNEPWVISGGLMTKDYRPKPALDRLSALIKSWTSSGSTRTDRSGNAPITGFAGDYEITVEKDGQRTVQRVHIAEQESGSVNVSLVR